MTVSFRFDEPTHAYIFEGVQVPSITQMLDRCGWTDEEFYTDASCERGTAVHRLTAEFDLDALDVPSCVSPYRPYLLSHVAAMGMIPHRHESIEEPEVHAALRFGGRPDRVGTYYGLRGVLEGKSGGPARSHQIQTALQAILVAPRLNLPPEYVSRLCLYWQPSGKFKLEEHRDRRDLDEAFRIIRKCAA